MVQMTILYDLISFWLYGAFFILLVRIAFDFDIVYRILLIYMFARKKLSLHYTIPIFITIRISYVQSHA